MFLHDLGEPTITWLQVQAGLAACTCCPARMGAPCQPLHLLSAQIRQFQEYDIPHLRLLWLDPLPYELLPYARHHLLHTTPVHVDSNNFSIAEHLMRDDQF